MDLVFIAGSDFVNVKLVGKKIYFKKLVNGMPVLQDLSRVNLPIAGLVKQFPDLEGKPDKVIRKEGAERLKEHIANMKTISERREYVIKELESVGCKLISVIQPGFRPVVYQENMKRK